MGKRRGRRKKHRSDREKKIIIASAASILVVIALGLAFIGEDSTGRTVVDKLGEIADSIFFNKEVSVESDEELTDLNGDGKIDKEDKKLAEELKKEELEKENEEKEEIKIEVNAGGTENGESIENTETTGSASKNETVKLPYRIPGTNLVIRKLAGYDGVYIEDGSDVDIADVATILVENTGSTPVEYADISYVHNGKTLNFKVSALPAGAKAAVQEQNKTTYEKGKTGSVTGTAAEVSELEMSKKSVKVTDNGDGSLTVKNLTNKKIPAVRIFYKFYMPEEGAYIGGITYTAKIENLKAKGSQVIKPSHYDSKSSKVMMVRTYDTTE